MKATKQLTTEHQAVKLMLQILDEIAKRLEKKEKIDPQHLDQLIEFIKVFVDGCHHAKEEDLLFPELEKVGIPREGGPIEVMLMDHDQERIIVKDLTRAVKEYQEGDSQAASKISQYIKSLRTLLLEHIDKEDNILYPIADMHLGEKEQDRLFEGFEKIENEKVGAGKHEQFHQMLDKLKEIYLQ